MSDNGDGNGMTAVPSSITPEGSRQPATPELINLLYLAGFLLQEILKYTGLGQDLGDCAKILWGLIQSEGIPPAQ